MRRSPAKEKTLLKIGDVAAKAGITLRTLRYYEELNLVEPDNRTKGNFRLYQPNVISRIRFINSLKKLDFSLDEIRKILGTKSSCETVNELIEKSRQALLIKKEKINNILTDMTEMNHEVDAALKMLDGCEICRDKNDNQCKHECPNKHLHMFSANYF